MSEGQRLRQQLRGILNQSVFGSLFAQAYNLQSYLKVPQNWAESPLQLSKIYQGMLIPHCKLEKKEMLPELWDEWIAFEAADKTATMDEGGYLMWAATGGKDLQWSKNLDLLKSAVQPAAATTELLKMIKENPNHPSLGTWMNDLNDVMTTVMGDAVLIQ